MKALILAAGYATRLYPLTRKYPKPLLPVKKRPIIDYIVDKLDAASQVSEIIVVTNSKFIRCFRKWEKALRISKPLVLVDDLTRDNASRLGAIGDVDFVLRKKKLKNDLLVIGGDNLFDAGLQGFLSFVKKHKDSPVIGAYDAKDLNRAKHYGVIRLDKNKRLVDFKEKPAKPRSTLIAMCLYYFPARSLALIRKYLKVRRKRHDATGLYIDWLKEKMPLYGFVFGGAWHDIGGHEFYQEARETF